MGEPPLMAEVRTPAAQGRKINAIEVYRTHTDISVKDAEDAEDAVERLSSMPWHHGCLVSDAQLNRSTPRARP